MNIFEIYKYHIVHLVETTSILYFKIYSSVEICPVCVRDWSQGSVTTGHNCQPALQLLYFLLSGPDVIVQAVDPSKLIRHHSLQPRVFLVSGADLLLTEPLSEVHHRGGPGGNGRSVDFIQVQVEADRADTAVCPFLLNSFKLGQTSLPGPLLGGFVLIKKTMMIFFL